MKSNDIEYFTNEIIKKKDLESNFFSDLGVTLDNFLANTKGESHHSLKELKLALEVFMMDEVGSTKKFGESVWVYGKMASKNDKEYLRTLLLESIEARNSSVYQLLCVLDSIGEKTLENSGSMFELECNFTKARLYLQKEGILSQPD